MKARDIHLHYRFTSGLQTGDDIGNPLFDALSALASQGSIQAAARALDLSYRHLWGSLKQWEEDLGEPLVNWQRGQPARLTPFAERLLWSQRQARGRMAPHIEALRNELRRVLAEATDGEQQVLRIDASHDLMLPTLQRLAGDQRLHLELRFAGSLDALRSLSEGRCVVAGFHAPQMDRAEHCARTLKALLKPGRHKLIGTMRRTQGLMVGPGNPMRLLSLADVARTGAGFVAREPGSGTRLLAEHLVSMQGLSLSALKVAATENSHVAAATQVAAGLADAALGIEAAARAAGLDFVPLLEEDYFLACLDDALQLPGVVQLRQLLASAAWARALRDAPGYALDPQAGRVLSLTRALPWWRFRRPRSARAAG